jgi:hypothetical protein
MASNTSNRINALAKAPEPALALSPDRISLRKNVEPSANSHFEAVVA